MAISAVDVREIRVAAARPVVAARPDARAADAAAPAARRRPPATVLATAAIGVVESLALLAGALTGLDGLLNSPSRPPGAVVLLVLLALATWIVLCAGGAATLVDAAGRRLVTWVATGETVLVVALFVASLVVPREEVPVPPALPLPALALLVLAVPVGKLLLASSPTALDWVAAGPRPRERRPDPVAAHRGLCVVTLAVIGLALGGVALLGTATVAGADSPGSVASSTR